MLAFSLGLVAHRLKFPPLVGYLVAGIVIGFAPAVGADQNIANQLSEVGVILLLFGVGLHFSLQDLLSVRAIAIPGAIAQGLIATPLGMAVGWALGWSPAAGFIFGLSLSVASTVVLLRMLQERRLLETERGKITIGWLIVQDIAMVLALVLLPAITGLFQGEAPPDLSVMLRQVAEVVGKLLVFTLAMLVVGKKLIPALLHYVAHTGSRELFRLAVLSIALGFAFLAAELFGVSLALGAFFAGMVLSESQLSQQAATESLPLRDAFAVLFFVSVGMLFHPAIMIDAPLAVLATVVIIIIGKSLAAFAVVRLFGQSSDTGLMISASLAQIGEFSFILASLGLALGVLPNEGRDLILAGAIITILLNPLLFGALDRYFARRDQTRAEEAAPEATEEEGDEKEATPTREPIPETALTDHVVLIGHGRVGRYVSKQLLEKGIPVYIVEDNAEDAAELNANGIEALHGNAADPEVIKSANLGQARCLLVAIPDAFEGGQVVEQARAINPKLRIVARAHSEAEIDHLAKHGADFVVMGEHEIGKAMLGELNGLKRPVTDAMASMATAGPIRGR
ncbi:putative Glutathione-regulated potassium-efflux system protein KefB [Methyloceanibacter caenitepidi]|uniref:Putative Glutathione-regulated potassium-efflux system protein KefB n=1 Tax=Methyloceanibacter caenitepidi TaxID=1384459 RepID=A0A0A8K1A4_9HYPH|nr:putative Glutathione-regulated potassium-efflux system protein KefB [Methyloceanibacter caenitepidi]